MCMDENLMRGQIQGQRAPAILQGGNPNNGLVRHEGYLPQEPPIMRMNAYKTTVPVQQPMTMIVNGQPVPVQQITKEQF